MRLVLGFFACLFLSLPLAEPAEAKRFGGGGFVGKSYSVPTKPKPAPTQQKAPADQKSQPVAPARSGMGGLMTGLLAGGLFGALLFGGAFEGLQLMDLILLAGLIYLIYRLFFAGKQASAAASTSAGAQYKVPLEPVTESAQPQPEIAAEGNQWSVASNDLTLPQWLDKETFLAGARNHFIRLQAAWDTSDWEAIRSYCTDTLFTELQESRSHLPAKQVTEVVSVMADIVRCVEQPDKVMISVHFYGWLQEDGTNTVEFTELWHLSRDMTLDNADWLIEGIEQH